MQLFVAGSRSGTFTLDVRPSDDVKRVKELILEREGLSLVQQELVFGGKELQHGRTLEFYGIEKESTVHIRLRGRGGGRGCGGDMSKPLTEALDEFGNFMTDLTLAPEEAGPSVPEAGVRFASAGAATPAYQAAAGVPSVSPHGIRTDLPPASSAAAYPPSPSSKTRTPRNPFEHCLKQWMLEFSAGHLSVQSVGAKSGSGWRVVGGALVQLLLWCTAHAVDVGAEVVRLNLVVGSGYWRAKQ